jgi:hypothetical protein
MPDQSRSQQNMEEPDLRRFREYVAAFFAALFIIATLILIIIAFINTEDEAIYSRMKDILLILLPYTGVVLGYYFSKVTIEARAEKAETAAQAALSTAQTATQERSEAVTRATESEKSAEEWKSSVAELYTLSNTMMHNLELTSFSPQGVSTGGLESTTNMADSGENWQKTRRELEVALERARQLLRNSN